MKKMNFVQFSEYAVLKYLLLSLLCDVDCHGQEGESGNIIAKVNECSLNILYRSWRHKRE